MNEDLIITVARECMITVITLASPMLLAGLAIGLTMSILQSVTSIQEQSLSMIPKMLTVLITLCFLMPWLLRVMKAFAQPLLRDLQRFIS